MCATLGKFMNTLWVPVDICCICAGGTQLTYTELQIHSKSGDHTKIVGVAPESVSYCIYIYTTTAFSCSMISIGVVNSGGGVINTHRQTVFFFSSTNNYVRGGCTYIPTEFCVCTLYSTTYAAFLDSPLPPSVASSLARVDPALLIRGLLRRSAVGLYGLFVSIRGAASPPPPNYYCCFQFFQDDEPLLTHALL